jgi:HD-GYP domain-containing protein (c-di-GMP phosphodiesterase class II)
VSDVGSIAEPAFTGRLFVAQAGSVTGLEPALHAERIDCVELGTHVARFADDAPAVVLLDGPVEDALAFELDPATIIVASEPVAARLPAASVAFTFAADAPTATRLRVLRNAFRLAAAQLAQRRAERELERTRNELHELHNIGMALMTERDPDRLLVQILDQAMRLTSSDAGSLYLSERAADGAQLLRFKLAQNDSIPDLPLVEFTLPADRSSVAGYAAVTAEPFMLDDAYDTPDAPYSLNRSFDERFGYRTKSMLVVPMADHRGEVVGVLQLINRKSDAGASIRTEADADACVLPYGDHELQLVRALAGHAAISIENSRLYAQIQNLFESFVKAAVTAIDQRDPTTAGHSIRVAALTIDIAQAVERHGTPSYADVRFTREQIRELRYAAMLHDFGKVGVREEVLIKAKKLPPSLGERVESRFDLIRRTVEAEYHRRRVDVLLQGDTALSRELDEEFRERMAELDRFHEAVRHANEPTVLPADAAQILDEIGSRSFETPAGAAHPYLTDEELRFLRIPRGTLNERERLEIESHVEQTYQFLRQIPWTDDLRNLPEIAYGHHEKLNGRGYPRGQHADAIPVQTRIMTISDIFDALTASDRPYKRALSVERALDILQMEARDGMLDDELVKLVIESQVYKRILEQDWREL